MNTIAQTKTGSRFIDYTSIVSRLLMLRDSKDNCRRIERFALLAYCLRDADIIQALGRHLLNSIWKRSIGAGGYFLSLGLIRAGQSASVVKPLLEEALSFADPDMRGRIILTLSGIAATENNLMLEMDYLKRCGESLWASTMACRIMAAEAGESGNHKDAVKMLEALWPSVRMAAHDDPFVYFDYQNSLALELAECGEIERARRCVLPVTRSILLPHYPEWQNVIETINQQIRRPTSTRIFVPNNYLSSRVIEFPRSQPRTFNVRTRLWEIALDERWTPVTVIRAMLREALKSHVCLNFRREVLPSATVIYFPGQMDHSLCWARTALATAALDLSNSEAAIWNIYRAALKEQLKLGLLVRSGG